MSFPTATATNGPNDTGTATLNALAGKITTGDLSSLGWESYTLTITNSMVSAGDICFASVANDTNHDYAGVPKVARINPANGHLVIVVWKASSDNAYDGNLVISFSVMKP